MKITSTHIFIGIVIIAIGLLIGSRFAHAPKTTEDASGTESAVTAGKYADFATCIKDSGAKFYGAFWCPHCHQQKLLFGDAVDKLPYIECSTPDKQGQTQVCIDAGITGYPTWEFSDKSRLDGEVSLDKLAEKTSCPLPS